MRLAFVGHFASRRESLGSASSPAGNQVQRQILKEMEVLQGSTYVGAWVMEPEPSWPRGRLIVKSHDEGRIRFLGFLNIPGIKHFVFSLRLMVALMRSRAAICIQYNSYLFENLALLLFRLIRRDVAIGMVIQDLHVLNDAPLLSTRSIRSWWERCSLVFAKRFDAIVPVCRQIIADFGFEEKRCLVFQGGVTDFARSLAESQVPTELGDFGVFAGALESYNGIDRLVRKWVEAGVREPLHVFGRGSLQHLILEISRHHPQIVYHGFQPDSEVWFWLERARWNFCLRYSDGLNQSYFFPSKLFNIVCAPGWPILNDFDGVPESMRNYLKFVKNDLANLVPVLASCGLKPSPAEVDQRRSQLLRRFSWASCIRWLVCRCREGMSNA